MSKTWSYSRLSTYETCPAKYKFSYIDKMPRGSSKAMDRGLAVHASVEAFVKKESTELHPEIHKEVRPALDSLLGLAGWVSEQAFFFNSKWELVPKEDEDRECTMILDLYREDEVQKLVACFDVKTGKQYESHWDQLTLYGVGLLHAYPWADMAHLGNIYTDVPKYPIRDFMLEREQLSAVTMEYERRVDRMRDDQMLMPHPGFYCRWCDFSKAKGGPCKF